MSQEAINQSICILGEAERSQLPVFYPYTEEEWIVLQSITRQKDLPAKMMKDQISDTGDSTFSDTESKDGK